MADTKYRVTVGDATYEVTAPDANTAWQWANMTHAQRGTTPQAAPAPPPPPPLKEPEGGMPMPWEYLTDREGAIKRRREYETYLQERQQQEYTKDIQKNEGFMDFVGDLVSSGMLNLRSGIKDVEAVIEQNPELKKKFQAEARRYAKNANTEVAGSLTTEDVKENWLKAVPFALQEFTRSAPSLAVMPLGAVGLAGQVARGRAEANGREDISGTDLAIAAPIAAVSTVLDRFGIGEIIGAAGKTAVIRSLKAGAAEGSTEAIQSTIEYLGSRVGTEQGADAREAFEQALWGAIVGGTAGGTLRGTGELVSAPFRGRAAAEPAAIEPTTAPEVRQEFQRLASQEIASIMAADPNMDQNAATSAVSGRAEELLAQATQNVAAATQGGAYEGAGVGTGLDVSGGLEPSVPDVGMLGGAAEDTGTVGKVVTGRLGEPDLGVPVPDVGEAAQPGALETAPPTAEIAPQPEPKLAFDTTPVYEASALKDRKSAAMQITSDVVQEIPELQGLPKNKYVQAAGQMAQAAAKGEQFDPVDVLYKVAEIERPAPEVAAPEGPLIPEGNAPLETFSGETVLQHGRSDEQVGSPLEGFTPSGEVAPEQRYGVEGVDLGGVFGAEGVYLASDPKWFTDMSGMYTPDIYDVSAPLENALVLTPDNIGSLPKKDTPWKGKEIADWAKSQGYDGIVVEGFDDLLAKLGAAQQPIDEEGGRAFKRSDFPQEAALSDLDSTSRGIQPDPNYVGELDVFSGYLRSKNVDPEVGQDQVFAFSPEKLKVLGKAKGPTERVNLRSAAAPTAPEGGTAPIDNTTVDKAVSAKLTKAQIKKLEEAAGIRRKNLTNMQKRIARSRDAQETMSLAGRLMLMARNPDEDVGLLSSLFNSIPPTVLQKLLGPLLTDDVVRLGEKAGMKAPARIDALMRNEYIPYVNRIMQRAAKLSEKWADYTARSETDALNLADVMFVANMYNADPSLAPNVTEYLKQDPEYQELLAKQTTEKDPKKLGTLKRQLGKRRGEIQRLYFGATDPDGAKIAGWNDLPAAGKQIFREARDEYQGTFDEHYRLLMERIDNADLEEDDAGRLKDAVNRMFAEARERVIYFPLKRFGEYWVTVGKGQSGEFHMFETASEQDAFLAQLRKDKDDRAVSSGFGRDSLRKLVGNKDASTALKGVLDMIEDTGVDDVNALKDQIFQMYLTALPEADMRRRFIHRQFKTGFSTDVLRTFASTAVASANQLGRLAYAQKFKNAIDEGYAETEGKPAKRRLDTITRELELRVNGTLSPEDNGGLDWLLSLGAKGTFLFLLSSPKSAIMNLTQLHIVGLPTLSAEFGEKATYGMAARYTGSFLTGQRIANPFRDEDGNVRLQIPNFTLENSAYIQGLKESDPERYAEIQKAWQFQAEHDITESTFAAATDIYERSNRPTGEYSFTQAARKGDVITAAQRGTANSIEAMGALFHNAERIGREIMFMSAFEMAYERGLKEGKTSEQAGNEARTLAAELTNKGMFDFSNWNKSRYSKHPAGRLPLQMRSYSLAMTSLLFRSFVGMLPLMNKEGKLASARVFFGVGAMTALYGGFRASQFYVMAMLGYGLYEFLKEMLGGEDEEDKEAEIEGGYLTDETIQREMLRFADEKGRELSKKDMEYFIRSAWIPETFGPGGTMATALGISDENAQKLSRVADMGIPSLFGVDVSNSVSLGDLWHPVDTKSQDPEARFYERLGRVALGPSGALLFAPFKAVEEANNGNFDKAIEATMPAIIRNFVKAERLKDEGLVVGKNRDVVLQDPSFYDTLTLAMQSLGFTEAETSRAMQMDIKAGEIEKEVSAAQTKLLDRRYRAILDFNKDPTPETEKAWKKVERDIAIYNLNYPSNEITPEDMEKSFQNKSNEAAERAGGLGYNPKIPIRQNEAEERAARVYGEQ